MCSMLPMGIIYLEVVALPWTIIGAESCEDMLSNRKLFNAKTGLCSVCMKVICYRGSLSVPTNKQLHRGKKGCKNFRAFSDKRGDNWTDRRTWRNNIQ